jgi:hypothetical protein
MAVTGHYRPETSSLSFYIHVKNVGSSDLRLTLGIPLSLQSLSPKCTAIYKWSKVSYLSFMGNHQRYTYWRQRRSACVIFLNNRSHRKEPQLHLR